MQRPPAGAAWDLHKIFAQSSVKDREQNLHARTPGEFHKIVKKKDLLLLEWALQDLDTKTSQDPLPQQLSYKHP